MLGLVLEQEDRHKMILSSLLIFIHTMAQERGLDLMTIRFSGGGCPGHPGPCESNWRSAAVSGLLMAAVVAVTVAVRDETA